MKKQLLSGILALTSGYLFSQNSLLVSPATGQPYSSGKIDDIAIVANATDVVLVGANNVTGKMYAIDINDNDPAEAAVNTLTAGVSTFKTKIEAALGVSPITVKNFEVNPLSKSIYVLALQGSNSYIAIVKNSGNTITAFPLNNVTYSEITFNSAGKQIQDITWGDNALYFSVGGASLAGEVGKVDMPFVHSSSAVTRATTMHKSNWGGYYTTAPLEKMDFNNVSGINRLCGVTVCAPGFSLKTESVTAGGLLTVTEDFDLWNGITRKVVSVKFNNTSYLIDLHDENFNGNYAAYRIGQKFLDGSQVPLNQYNNTSKKLRSNGNPAAGLTNEEMKKYAGYYTMIAFYNNCELLVLNNSDVLMTMSTELCTGVGLNENKMNNTISVYPNPASSYFKVKGISDFSANISVSVFAVDGRQVASQKLDNENQDIDISHLGGGTYFVQISNNGEVIFKDKLIK
jgi:hypothetical protein